MNYEEYLEIKDDLLRQMHDLDRRIVALENQAKPKAQESEIYECALCGGLMNTWKNHHMKGKYGFECSECGLVIGGFENEKAAVNAWNKLAYGAV